MDAIIRDLQARYTFTTETSTQDEGRHRSYLHEVPIVILNGEAALSWPGVTTQSMLERRRPFSNSTFMESLPGWFTFSERQQLGELTLFRTV
jgi:hypothetical protein